MTKHFSLGELSKLTDAELIGDSNATIKSVDNLETASINDASFLANPIYKEAMKHSNAGVICVDKTTNLIEGKNYLISDNPSRIFQLIAELVLSSSNCQSGFSGIHPTAVIHKSAKIGRDVTIGPYVVIDIDVKVDERTIIYSHSYIGAGVVIGKDCILYSHSSVRERCILGNRVTLQSGAIIGSCGFGYTTNPKTGQHTKLKQIGNVIIEDDVEIGANTTIDRARFKTTYIEKGTKIDNLVQIGHNVNLGKNNIIVSQTGIAGSTKLGNNVFLGGQAGIVGHVSICNNVKIATRGGVSKNLSKPGVYGGSPVSPMPEFNKRQVLLRKIETYVKEIANLKNRLEKLEKYLT